MLNLKTPALWLLVFIIGLPQLSETVYTPSLPQIASALSVEEHWVEFTLTIYLMGFAVGTIFWGYSSDRFGRKPCLLSGLVIYCMGCLGCYFSTSIETLMLARFVQALGGSTGSVLGQAICREAFSVQERGRIFSTIGSALSLAPAIGPIIGGLITQTFDWSSIFLFLLGAGFLIFILCGINLPETNFNKGKKDLSILMIWKTLIKDKRVMGFCGLIGLGNGIIFSYYAEAPFYMIEMLGLTPSQYGLTFILIAFAAAVAGLIGRHMFKTFSGEDIIQRGLVLILGGALILIGSILSLDNAKELILLTTLGAMLIVMMGINLTVLSSLSMALGNYQSVLGTASALFGFMYYVIISGTTFLMGLLHNDTLLPMPIFFLALAVTMIGIYFTLIRQRADVTV